MPGRSTWKGYLKLSLVSVPVKAYTAAASGGGEIHLNQLHAECHSRIQYKKFCPIHGEVANDAIVSGYEQAKGQYVVIDPEELDKLRTESDKAITVDVFIEPTKLDPIYYDKTYYLVPDGPVGQKPYGVLHRGMIELNRHAVAQVVLHNREQIVLLRPLDGLLALTTLYYENQIKRPASFQDEVPQVEIPPKELDLAKMLIEASTTEEFAFGKYQDAYTDRLTKLIEMKVAGQQIVAPSLHEEAQVINLMDALRESVARAQKTAKARPPKKMAPSTGQAAPARKRKTS
jgi:DNA end-binding protein Ku